MEFKGGEVHFTAQEIVDTGFLSPMPTDPDTIVKANKQLQQEEIDLEQDFEDSYRLTRSDQAQLPLRRHTALRKRMVINQIAREKGIEELL